MNGESTIIEIQQNSKINVPEESFKDENKAEPNINKRKGKWFSFKKDSKPEKKLITNEIVLQIYDITII